MTSTPTRALLLLLVLCVSYALGSLTCIDGNYDLPPKSYVDLRNDFEYPVEVCWLLYGFDGPSSPWRSNPIIQPGTLYQRSFGPIRRGGRTYKSALVLRRVVPNVPRCRGPRLSHVFQFKAGRQFVSAKGLRGACAHPGRRHLPAWPRNVAQFTGAQGEVSTWEQVIQARNAPYKAWRVYRDYEGLFPNVRAQMWEVNVANDQGINTMRLICSFDKNDNAIFRGVISHVRGLSNGFVRATRTTTAEFEEAIAAGCNAADRYAFDVQASAQACGVQMEEAASDALADAIEVSGDAEAVGEAFETATALGEFLAEAEGVAETIAMLAIFL